VGFGAKPQSLRLEKACLLDKERDCFNPADRFFAHDLDDEAPGCCKKSDTDPRFKRDAEEDDLDLWGEAVGDPEEEICEEDADNGGGCELKGESEHKTGKRASLFPVGPSGGEEKRVDELINRDKIVGLCESIEKEKRAIETEESGE
jgi:hypothetical protein